MLHLWKQVFQILELKPQEKKKKWPVLSVQPLQNTQLVSPLSPQANMRSPVVSLLYIAWHWASYESHKQPCSQSDQVRHTKDANCPATRLPFPTSSLRKERARPRSFKSFLQLEKLLYIAEGMSCNSHCWN
jgi:hypothetical protein